MSALGLRRLLATLVGLLGVALMASTVLAAQTADTKIVSTNHGVAKAITLSGTSDLGVAAFNITDGPSHGNLDLPVTGPMVCVPDGGTFGCSAGVLYTPSPTYEGPDSFTYNVEDADGTSGDASVSITVGSAPVAIDDPGTACGDHSAWGGSFPIPEDWPEPFAFYGSCALLTNDTDADGDPLTWSVDTDPQHGTLTKLGGFFDFAYQPDPNFSTIAGDQPGGSWVSDSFTYVANDGALDSNPATMKFWIAPINDPPSFTAGPATVSVNEDSGPYSATWATDVSPGPQNESSQTVHFEITNLDLTGVPNLFSVAPAIDAHGVLTFTPGPDEFGLAQVTVRAVDDGGLEDYGVTHLGLPVPDDTSDEVTFDINVDSVNDAPTFTPGADVTVNQNSPAYTATGWATDISAGPSNESSQAVSFAFTSDDNATLFSSAPVVGPDGALYFTPAVGRSGTAHLTLQAQDDGGIANGGVDTSGPVAVTIRINAPPNAMNDTTFSVPENSPGQVLDVMANDTSPDDPEALLITSVTQPLHGTVTIINAGTAVSYQPASMYYGDNADFFTYTITDPGGLTDTATVILSIVKDTTPPTVASPAQRIRQGVALTSTTLPGLVTWSGSDAGVGIGHYELQRSVNAGAWTNVALSAPTATTAYVTYAFGSTSYRFRVRGVDANGNASDWLYTATFHDARYEERNTALIYGGSWFLTYNSNDSGGAAKYTTVNGRSVTMTRKFRDIGVVTMKGPTRGSVAIYVDGIYRGTVSLKASTTRYRQLVWTGHFGLATHTIRIVAVGNVRLDFDCFVTLY